MAHLASEFRLLVNYKVVALQVKFLAQLESSWLDIWAKIYAKKLTDVQAGILIRIGLGFGANFLWFLAPIGLKFNWVGLL